MVKFLITLCVTFNLLSLSLTNMALAIVWEVLHNFEKHSLLLTESVSISMKERQSKQFLRSSSKQDLLEFLHCVDNLKINFRSVPVASISVRQKLLH